ncbi:MAG: alpha/beta fold hydrolase [Betaproteobacteria bacterium]|nr:alpha/beta fold hydrolase [Betaproteobacteria bacterium]
MRRVALGGLIVLGVLYGLLLLTVYFKQEALIFHPIPLPADERLEAANVDEVSIPVEGAVLSALHLKLAEPKGVVFFLHGNSGNLRSWMTNIEFYRRVNYDLFMIDYRGFGKSTGNIESEAQLLADIRAAWAFVSPRYQGKKTVIYGRSLGSGLAAGLARDVQPDLTMLVTPYSSLDEMARERYPWIPTALNRYPLPTDRWLTEIKKRIFIIHGDQDAVIPIRQAFALQKLRPDATMLVVPGAGHNDIQRFPLYLDTIAATLAAL